MSNTSSADALRGSTQTRAAPAAWFCRCWRSLRLKEHRAGSASRDATGVAVQRLAEARGAERDRAQQDMFADSHPRDVGDAARRTASQLEQTEVRGTAANINDQDVPQIGIVSRSFPQRVSRTVLFQPAIEGCLGLLE